jgi:hypothetical protein
MNSNGFALPSYNDAWTTDLEAMTENQKIVKFPFHDFDDGKSFTQPLFLMLRAIQTVENSQNITFDVWRSWVGQPGLVRKWLERVQARLDTSYGLPEFLAVTAKLRVRLGPDFSWQSRSQYVDRAYMLASASCFSFHSEDNDDHSSSTSSSRVSQEVLGYVLDTNMLGDTTSAEKPDFNTFPSTIPMGETTNPESTGSSAGQSSHKVSSLAGSPISSRPPLVSESPLRGWSKSLRSVTRRWMRSMSVWSS